MAIVINPIPENIPDLVAALLKAGFTKNQDTPGSASLELKLPNGCYILVSNDVGGWWPEVDADGVAAALYTASDEPVEASGQGLVLMDFEPEDHPEILKEQIEGVVEALARWTA